VIPLRCRCWHCDECAPARKAQLVNEAKQGRPDLFITLTSRNRSKWTADYAAVQLAKAWRIVRAEFLRLHGKNSLPFLAVFERTKRGWPHIHIVARCHYLDRVWLSNRMKDLTDGPSVHVRRIHGKSKVAAYICKYLSKNPERFPGTKRYWRSRDYLVTFRKPPVWAVPQPDHEWSVVKEDWRSFAGYRESRGQRVTWERYEATIWGGGGKCFA